MSIVSEQRCAPVSLVSVQPGLQLGLVHPVSSHVAMLGDES